MTQNDFKIGDIITTYHKGYWRLVAIKRRFLTDYDVKTFQVYKNKKVGDEYSPIFEYEQVLSADFKPRKGNKKQCDATYCRKVSKQNIEKMKEEFRKKVQEFYAGCDKLEALLET